VFRVAEAPVRHVGAGLLIASAAVAAANQSWWPLLGLSLTPLALLFKKDVCSACRTAVAPSVTRCPGCGGDVKGRIRSRAEHATAEQAFLEAAQHARAAEARDVVKALFSKVRDDEPP
jgi:predicted amidophosphoribosyltransferase